jgi:hypothetical protein
MSADHTANMALWNKLELTDTRFVKQVKLDGRRVTTVDQLHNVKRLTEELGPVGFAWGWEVKSERTETYGDGQDQQTIHTAVVRAWFRQPDGTLGHVEHVGTTKMAYWTRPQGGSPRFFIDHEAPKKSVTDALKKIMVNLGASADIWLGRFDGDKYVPPQVQAEDEPHDPETGVVSPARNGKAPQDHAQDQGRRTYALNGKRYVADEWIVAADEVSRKLEPGKLAGFLEGTKATRNQIYKYEAEARARCLALSEDIHARALGAAASEGVAQ